MGKGGERSAGGGVAMMTASLLGGAVAAAVALALLLLCSALIAVGALGQGLEWQLVLAACVIGGFCGGHVTCRKWGRRLLPAGLSAGAVLLLLLLTVGLAAFQAEAQLSGTGLGVVAGSLCGGGAAGLVGSRSGKKKKRTY